MILPSHGRVTGLVHQVVVPSPFHIAQLVLQHFPPYRYCGLDDRLLYAWNNGRIHDSIAGYYKV